MSKIKTDYLLIEYILALLDAAKKNNIDIDCLLNKDRKEALALLPDAQNIHTAYELINLMNEMPGGFFIYRADEDEEILYANKAMLHIFRCDTLKEFQELTGNSFKGMVHPDDLEVIEQSITKQITHSKFDLDYVEYRIIRRDGEIRWIEDYGHFIHSESAGNFFYVFIGDATEKRKRMARETESLLNEKEQKLQNIIAEYDKERESINQEYLRRLEVIEGLSINYESILYVDLDKNTILPYRLSSRTQKQFCQKFQVREFLWFVSDYVDSWVHPDDQELVARICSPEYIRKKLSASNTYYTNYRIICNGMLQYLQLRIVNVGSGEHVSQIVMGYRRVDEEIQRELEQHQMLESALNSANLAIIAKNTFLANMSHDMRTPLNAIFGFTTLARKNSSSDTLKKYLDKIDTASSQLLELIDKVLEVSWLESNHTDIVEEECNINEVMKDIYNFLLPRAVEKNISFSLNTDKVTHPDIYSDHDRIKQLLLYIADNAITYTESEGQVSMTAIELEILPNDFALYQFEIKDNGIGISEDFLSHIFEPFEREKNTTFSGIHGTGLGLAIAKNIVDMMGGNITVNSVVNEGSTFTITLTLRMQEVSPAPSDKPEETAPCPPDNQRILLVEDNEINLEIETEILSSLGFIIDTATDGSIAVEKLKQAQPGYYTLILMDIQMPVMDGWQAARAIRKLDNPELSSIPIIALSANAFESDKRASIESGMDAHLTKPVDIPRLLEMITKLTH